MTSTAGTEAFAGHGDDAFFLQKSPGEGNAREAGLSDIHHDEHAAFGHAGGDFFRAFQGRDERSGAGLVVALHPVDFGEAIVEGVGHGILEEGLGAEEHGLGYGDTTVAEFR